MKNIENQIGQLSKEVATQSSGGCNRNTLDCPRDDEVERELEEEFEVFGEGRAEKE